MAVDRGAGFVGEFAAVSVAPMLGLTSRGAEERVRTAAGLVSRLPGVLAAMGAGELDAWRASIVVAETAETTAEACARVEGMVLPRICAESGGRVRARVRRALARVDADAVRVRAAKARLERSVRVFPSHVVGLPEFPAVRQHKAVRTYYTAQACFLYFFVPENAGHSGSHQPINNVLILFHFFHYFQVVRCGFYGFFHILGFNIIDE